MATIPGEVRQDFMNALLNAFPDPGALARFADFQLDVNLDHLGGHNFEDKVYELMKKMEALGRMREFATKASEAVSGSVLLAAAAQNVCAALNNEATWYQPPANPFDTCFVQGGRPFIGRGPLRQGLQQLLTRDNSGIVVTGNPGTGKSYSLRLIAYVCQAYEGNHVVYVDLDQRGAAFGPGELTDLVLRGLGRSSRTSDKPPRDAQDTRWAKDLAEFIGEEIRDMDETCWLVFDGADPAVIAKETHDLVTELLRIEFRFPMRIVLLDYLEPPAEIEPWVITENLPDVDVTLLTGLLTDFFKDVASHRGLGVDDAGIALIVKEVLDQVGNKPDDLSDVAAAVTRVARALAT
jgi:Effector-associated domain 1/AAA domain